MPVRSNQRRGHRGRYPGQADGHQPGRETDRQRVVAGSQRVDGVLHHLPGGRADAILGGGSAAGTRSPWANHPGRSRGVAASAPGCRNAGHLAERQRVPVARRARPVPRRRRAAAGRHGFPGTVGEGGESPGRAARAGAGAGCDHPQHGRRRGRRRRAGATHAVQPERRAHRRRRHDGPAGGRMARHLRGVLPRRFDSGAGGPAARHARHSGRDGRRPGAVHPQSGRSGRGIHQRERQPVARRKGRGGRRGDRLPRRVGASAAGRGADAGLRPRTPGGHRHGPAQHRERGSTAWRQAWTRCTGGSTTTS